MHTCGNWTKCRWSQSERGAEMQRITPEKSIIPNYECLCRERSTFIHRNHLQALALVNNSTRSRVLMFLLCSPDQSVTELQRIDHQPQSSLSMSEQSLMSLIVTEHGTLATTPSFSQRTSQEHINTGVFWGLQHLRHTYVFRNTHKLQLRPRCSLQSVDQRVLDRWLNSDFQGTDFSFHPSKKWRT